MDLTFLAQSCATALACGGFEALGTSLMEATLNLIKHRHASKATDDPMLKVYAMGALSNPEQFAKEAYSQAQRDETFRALLEDWIEKASQFAQTRNESSANDISHSNFIGTISGSGVVIHQTIGGKDD